MARSKDTWCDLGHFPLKLQLLCPWKQEEGTSSTFSSCCYTQVHLGSHGMRLLGRRQVSFPSARISGEDLFWWSISPWSGASWKIVEWNVPPALGFGNSERFCLEIGRCLRWASEWADSASHCSLHLDRGRRLEPPLLVRVEHGERALVLWLMPWWFSSPGASFTALCKAQPSLVLASRALETGVRTQFTHPTISFVEGLGENYHFCCKEVAFRNHKATWPASVRHFLSRVGI